MGVFGFRHKSSKRAFTSAMGHGSNDDLMPRLNQTMTVNATVCYRGYGAREN